MRISCSLYITSYKVPNGVIICTRHATDNIQSYHKIDTILRQIRTVAKADKAVHKDCGTVFGLLDYI